LKIYGNGDHVIEKRVFRPATGEYAIRIDEHSEGRVIIRNCAFIGAGGGAPDGLSTTAGGGILAWKSSHLTIENNYFEFIRGFCFRAPRTSPAFVNKTNPPDTVVADNDWATTLDWPTQARESLSAPVTRMTTPAMESPALTHWSGRI